MILQQIPVLNRILPMTGNTGCSSSKGRLYASIQPTLPPRPWFVKHKTFEKYVISTICRLRLGHSCTPVFLNKIRIRDNAICDCGISEGTPDHIFLNCQNYSTSLYDIFPSYIHRPLNLNYLLTLCFSSKIKYLCGKKTCLSVTCLSKSLDIGRITAFSKSAGSSPLFKKKKSFRSNNGRKIYKTMRQNQNIKLQGAKIILIPYETQHVPKYHTWMESKELQDLTASQPLSLSEEFNMQRSWREDEDKCTFIVLHKATYENTKNEIDSMIGDTNIFIIDKELAVGEIEIMIAESWARGQKLGWEAVILMLIYGIEHIGLKAYEAKISLKNNISIQMFKKLGFFEKSVSEIFQEVTLEKFVTEDWNKWLHENSEFKLQAYND